VEKHICDPERLLFFLCSRRHHYHIISFALNPLICVYNQLTTVLIKQKITFVEVFVALLRLLRWLHHLSVITSSAVWLDY